MNVPIVKYVIPRMYVISTILLSDFLMAAEIRMQTYLPVVSVCAKKKIES